jgi:hypothetical protein
MQGNHPTFLTKAELQTAQALGLAVLPGLLAIADEGIRRGQDPSSSPTRRPIPAS